MVEKPHLYFAYGSNMDLEQMNMRCFQGYEVLGQAQLEGYKFFINQRGFANVAKEKSTVVYGLLFNLNTHALNTLDRYEGTPELYSRNKLPVRFKSEIKNPWVYIDKASLKIGIPRPKYLEKIIVAAKDFKFPEEYIAHLESFLV